MLPMAHAKFRANLMSFDGVTRNHVKQNGPGRPSLGLGNRKHNFLDGKSNVSCYRWLMQSFLPIRCRLRVLQVLPR
jgi:hypothetical protein